MYLLQNEMTEKYFIHLRTVQRGCAKVLKNEVNVDDIAGYVVHFKIQIYVLAQ